MSRADCEGCDGNYTLDEGRVLPTAPIRPIFKMNGDSSSMWMYFTRAEGAGWCFGSKAITQLHFVKKIFFLQNYSRLEILEICAVCAIVHRGSTLLSVLFNDFISQATPSRRSPGRPSGATRPPSLATWP